MASYDANVIRDIVLTNPAEGSTPPSELNDADREVKRCLAYHVAAIAPLTTNTTLAYGHHILLCDATAGAFALTLPTASTVASSTYSKEWIILKVDGSANAVTVTGTVSGAVNPTLTSKYQVMVIECDGTSYYDTTPGQPVKFNTTANDITLTTYQCYNQVVEVSAAKTVSLPAGAKGMNLIVRVTAAVTGNVDPNGTEQIMLNGVALTAGHKISSTGVINDTVALYHNGTYWIIPGYCSWTDGG